MIPTPDGADGAADHPGRHRIRRQPGRYRPHQPRAGGHGEGQRGRDQDSTAPWPGPAGREALLAELQTCRPVTTAKFTGEDEEQKESQVSDPRLYRGLFLIFLILVTLFNSVAAAADHPDLGDPVPWAGRFWGSVISLALWVIMTGVGIISLAGVVVNNAIVLIDYTNKLRAGACPASMPWWRPVPRGCGRCCSPPSPPSWA
jgi:hypothetical protein